MRASWVVAVTCLFALSLMTGCGSQSDSDGERKDYPLPPPPSLGGMAPRPGSETPEAADELPGTDPAGPAASEAGADAPAEPEAPAPDSTGAASTGQDTERVKADVGVGQAGRSLDEYEGVIVTPAKTLFTVREKAVFQIQIPQALQLYKATNGSNPKTHKEFMTQIIEANQIQLPELPAGQRYVWDPDQGELMVEKPR